MAYAIITPKGGVILITSILNANTGICPYWNVEVSISGWYKQVCNDTWQFFRAECPIIENSKLPRDEQIQKYELMYCPENTHCPLYTAFQPLVTNTI